ncbi:hypothetical protein T484DRAFT_1810859, partial [Baffinella frigidus]
VESDSKEMLFEWSSSSSLDLRLPTGTITLVAQVKDALGALSAVMTSSVEVVAAAARRRLPSSHSGDTAPYVKSLRSSYTGLYLQTPSHISRASLVYTDGPAGGPLRRSSPSFDWAGADDLMATELLAGNLATLNEVASSLILEVDSQAGDTSLAADDALAQTEAIFSKLEAAAVVVNSGRALSQDYACTSLLLASTLSSDPTHLTPTLTSRLLSHLTLLVSDEHATIPSLPPACAASAITTMSHALRATAGNARFRKGLRGWWRASRRAADLASTFARSSITRDTFASGAWKENALPPLAPLTDAAL